MALEIEIKDESVRLGFIHWSMALYPVKSWHVKAIACIHSNLKHHRSIKQRKRLNICCHIRME